MKDNVTYSLAKNKDADNTLNTAHAENTPEHLPEYLDGEELIEMDRFNYDPKNMILSEADRLDIMRTGKGALTEDERLSRLFSQIRSDRSHEFRKLMSEDRSIINRSFKDTYLIHEACRRGAVDIVTFLLFSNADCHIQDSNGMYPQHYAAISNAPVLIDIMSVFGHDLNVKDSNGNTPLHHAVLHNNKIAIHMLMNYKVRILKNDENNTPIDIANDSEILQTLKEYKDR